MASGSTTYYRAVYDFNTQLVGELPLNTGDVVLAEDAIDKDWLYGTCISRMDYPTGLFPDSFVTRVNIRSVHVGEKLYLALDTFRPQEMGDLELFKGDLIIGLRQIDLNWIEGEICGNSAKRGIFPRNFVREIPVQPSKFADQRHNFITKNDIHVKAKVKMKLEAKLPEELSLNVGEIVYIEKFLDKIWCEGKTADGRRGIFPKGFVESLSKSDDDGSSCSKDHISTTISAKSTLPKPLPDYTSAVTSSKISDPVTTQAKLWWKQSKSSSSNLGSSLSIEPYARTKYAFRAEYPEELSFCANLLVKLIKHVDDEWTLGELNGKKGIFPTSYVDIIMDCQSLLVNQHQEKRMPNSKDTMTLYDNDALEARRRYTVMYDFPGTVQGDLKAKAGDLLIQIRRIDDSWIEAVNDSTNQRGIIPLDFLRECGDDAKLENARSHEMRNFRTSNNNDHNTTNDLTVKLEDSISKNIQIFSGNISPSPTKPEKIDLVANDRSWNYRSTSVVSSLDTQLKASSPPPRPAASPSLKQGNIHDDLAEQRRQKQEQKKIETRSLRTRIFNEVIQSERDYCRDLNICCDTFSWYGQCLDVNTLLAGFRPIIDLSVKFQDKLLEESNKDFVYQEIGSAFLCFENEFKDAYGGFCQSQEDAQLLLNNYDAELTNQRVLQEILRKIQSKTVCMDLSSMLSRPVQRVLKYPLFISELLKCTEDNQSDKVKLMMALKVMTEVAQCINETKRRKDLVLKYRKEGDVNLSERLSRFNMHTFRKKSSRLSMRLSTTIGFSQSIKDEVFDTAEKQFRTTEKLCRSFVRDVQLYCEQMLMRFNHESMLAEDFYVQIGDNGSLAKANFDALSAVLSTEVQHFFDVVNERVREPSNAVLQACKGPEKLIAKRNDKLLDFESFLAKTKKERGKSDASDTSKTKSLDEELRRSKVDYEALNTQLKTELPRFCGTAQDIVLLGAKAFIAAQRSFIYSLANKYHNFQSDSSHTDSMEKIVERFMQSSRNVTSYLNKLTFAHSCNSAINDSTPAAPTISLLSRSPSSIKKHSKNDLISAGQQQRNGGAKIVFPQKPQSDVDRKFLKTKYSDDKLYAATEAYQPSSNEIDLTVKRGDLLGVVVDKDPMGDRARWFVDNGTRKGFVPALLLEKFRPVVQQSVEESSCKSLLLDLSSPVSGSDSGIEATYTQIIKRPPKITEDTRQSKSTDFVTAKNAAQSISSTNNAVIQEIQRLVTTQSRRPSETVSNECARKLSPPPGALLKPVRTAPSPPAPIAVHDISNGRKTTSRLTRSDSYSSAVNSGQQQQGHHSQHRKRSTTDTERSADTDRSADANPSYADDSVEFYTALYNFGASSDSELSLTVGQLVAVHAKHDLEFNGDWWLVENESGDIGYVPANYLEPFRA